MSTQRRDRRSRQGRESSPRADRQRRSRLATALLPWLPSLLAVFLAVPGFSFTWLWDDFDFIDRVLRFQPAFLLPDPNVIFYRPLSREVAFGVMWLAGGGSPIAGHVVNALALAVAVSLLVSLASDLVSPRAGIVAGLAFASLGAVPILVAWASGIQDLLAILLFLASLRLAVRGRAIAAAAMFGAAAISKETTLALLPVVAGAPWILGRRTARPWRTLSPFVAVAVAWAAIAPGVRALIGRIGGGGAGAEVGYVRLGGDGVFDSLLRSLLTLLNVPVPGSSHIGLPGAPALALVGLALLLVTAWYSRGIRDEKSGSLERPAPRSVALLAAASVLLPALLTSALVRDWSPYYVAFPAVGGALLIGLASEHVAAWATPLILAAYLAMGLWTRGTSPGATVTCESNLARSSRALRQVEAGFKSLYPTFPHGVQALVSVASSGSLGVHIHLHRFQALRVWYKDSSIVTRSPERYRSDSTGVLLFRVIPTLDVVEIDPEHFLYRSSGARPGPTEVSRPARSYVRAIAADGDPLRAAEFQRRIAGFGSGEARDYDLRLASMYLLMAGRKEQAHQLIDSLPPLNLDAAVPMIKKVYEESPPTLDIRPFAFEAFGIAESNLDAERALMGLLRADGNLDLAAAVAREILVHSSTDAGARAVILEFQNYRPPDRITSDAELDPD